MTSTNRGSDLVVQALSTAGTSKIFSLSGNQIMSVFDACIDSNIDLMHVRQEAAAVHMADSWGRLTGQPGVALVTAGPGFANTLSALYVAKMAESPVVLLSGHSPHKDGIGSFQEMAQSEMARPVTKASWKVNEVSMIGSDVAEAFKIAGSGRPGPVHLGLPVDLLESTVATEQINMELNPGRFLDSNASGTELQQIFNTLCLANRPLVLAGPHMARGRARILLADLAERTDLPIVFMESPRGTADPSLGAFSDVLPEADAVLLLGKKLDFSLKMGRAPLFTKDCKFLLVDYEQVVIDEARSVITEPACLEVAAIGSPLKAARKIFSEMPGSLVVDRGWTEKVKSAIAYSPRSWDRIETLNEDEDVHPLAVGRSVRDFMSRQQDAVFVSDGGEFGQWAQAMISVPDRVINGPSGAIGGGVPFALGARCARPDSPIFLTSGDGSFGYHIMEIDTAVRYNLPFVAIVGNDATWNAEYQIQLRDYGEDRLIGCELLPTRYDLLVESLGGFGVHVTSVSQLPLALEKALASGLPSCVNVEIQRAHAPTVSRLKE